MEQRRTIVDQIQPTAGSERTACRWLGFHRSMVRYQGQRPDEGPLRARLRTLAGDHPRWGSPMLIWQLRQEGVRDNHKRLYRLYRAEGLAVRRQRRKRPAQARVPAAVPTRANERWSMDFMRDTLADGRAIRLFTLLDDCTREAPVILVDYHLTAGRVVTALEGLARTRGLPAGIVLDNGPEFQSRALHGWAQRHHVRLQFIRPGKPVDNAFIESFNGRLRDECLNQHWFLSLRDAQHTIEAWRVRYNTARPHRGLHGRTPMQYALTLRKELPPLRLSA
jgi:putative transposase